MRVSRRNFIKTSGLTSALMLAGTSNVNAALLTELNSNQNSPSFDASISTSIKAGFGDKFSVRNSTTNISGTYAHIQHEGNQYIVASKDLIRWEILSADIL